MLTKFGEYILLKNTVLTKLHELRHCIPVTKQWKDFDLTDTYKHQLMLLCVTVNMYEGEINCVCCLLLVICCRTNDLREKLNSAQEQLRQLDMDIEESQGS